MIEGCGTKFRGDRLMRGGSPNTLETGFTLIELMLASTILLIGVISVISMVLFALSENYLFRVESAALRLSQQKIEELRSLPIDDTNLTGPGNPLDEDGKIDFKANSEPAYSSSTSLTLNKTKNTTLYFETRWSIVAQGTRKIITVATRKSDGNLRGTQPVNLKLVKSP
jgi:Tfp pilus assembly protein PilV